MLGFSGNDCQEGILALAIEQVVVSPLAITHHPAKRFHPPTQSPILVGRGHKLLQFIATVFVFDTFAGLLAEFRIRSAPVSGVDRDIVVWVRSAVPDLLEHLLIGCYDLFL